jgi:hypothetical protein
MRWERELFRWWTTIIDICRREKGGSLAFLRADQKQTGNIHM